jgi:hypothetical protein
VCLSGGVCVAGGVGVWVCVGGCVWRRLGAVCVWALGTSVVLGYCIETSRPNNV